MFGRSQSRFLLSGFGRLDLLLAIFTTTQFLRHLRGRMVRHSTFNQSDDSKTTLQFIT